MDKLSGDETEEIFDAVMVCIDRSTGRGFLELMNSRYSIKELLSYIQIKVA